VRVQPVRDDHDARPMPDSREGSLAAATAIAIILVFVVVAIVGYWAFTFRIG
jgi:hypothetical protein